MSLRQFIEMGKQDKPWVFAPMAHSAIAQSGYDPELWFLLAENLASLGLKTIAEAQLDALCQRRPSAATTPMVTDLRERIDQLPDDRIEQAELIANAERSAQTLLAHGIDLLQDLETWKQNQAGAESFRAADGNIVRLAGEQLLHFGDQLGAARDIGEQNIAKVAQSHAPFTIEGVDPPWLLIELDKQTPIGGSGYQPGIRIIQSDVQEFLDGCSMADISQILSQERVELFIGAAAAEQLKASLARDAGTPISGPYMPLRSLRTPIAPSTTDLMRSAIAQQDAEHSGHLKTIHKRDAERDESWWRKRLLDATSGKAEPLRVLITTCRFTTVLHSMCVDLAKSLRGRGCEVELLIDPGLHRRLSPLAYSEALDRFDPDVILAPNYTRRDLEFGITGSYAPPPEARVLPTGVPFVVWIQDAMPHLLSTEAGAAIGPLDVTAGYVGRSMVADFGFPSDSVVPAQLVASQRRFNTQSAKAGMDDRYACDVAMMTHHSETPEALRDRLLGELESSPNLRKAAESMLPGIEHIIRTTNEFPGSHRAARDLVGQQELLDMQAKELLLQCFVLRLIDRTLRHQTAAWASAICKERGLAFRIFGKGWQDHPTLAEHAGGELPHNDALCAAYAAAGITLHVSAFNLLHQRIFECALSGGCPIVRMFRTYDPRSLELTRLRILNNLKPDEITGTAGSEDQVYWYDRFRSSDTARYTLLQQRLGEELTARIGISPQSARDTNLPIQPEADPQWILGDFDDMSFDSKDKLAAVIERSANFPEWRTSAGRGVANRSHNHFTHDALAKRLIDKLRERAS